MTLPETSYPGRHARLYDLFYADKPYAAEARFVHDCICQYGQGESQRMLELACGTGNHAFEMEKLGYQVIATDYSADMLSQAQQKAREKNSHVEFRQQDMRMLDISERPFDVVICLFDSIGYVATNENILRVLKGVHLHLRPEGLFIFEFWHAPAILKNYDPVRVKRWTLPERKILRVSGTELDYANQQARVTYTIYEFFANGTYKMFTEMQINRYFLLQEMKGWLSSCGFQMVKAFNGFKSNENISDDTWHVITVARSVIISD